MFSIAVMAGFYTSTKGEMSNAEKLHVSRFVYIQPEEKTRKRTKLMY